MTEGNRKQVRKMTVRAVTKFLAQIQNGSRVTVHYGKRGCFVFYGSVVLSKESRNRWPLSVQKVRLTADCTLRRDQNSGEWVCFEDKGVKGIKRYNLVAVKAA